MKMAKRVLKTQEMDAFLDEKKLWKKLSVISQNTGLTPGQIDDRLSDERASCLKIAKEVFPEIPDATLCREIDTHLEHVRRKLTGRGTHTPLVERLTKGIKALYQSQRSMILPVVIIASVLYILILVSYIVSGTLF